ncbi:MAG TPA: GMC family oxidoreductase [Rhodocyclaceae bacterium]|nr:GMC family oxidoreductase [Rhodocyclaceae bacterium]
MISDANAIPRDTCLQASICIIGTGAAGIPLALKLSGHGLSIIVLEAGYLAENAQTQSLYAGEVADERLHSPPDKYRQRRFGGSTAIWGGRCMPFDPIDFEAREYLPGSGWPIAFDELAPFYPEANKWAEAGQYEYDADVLFGTAEEAMFQGFTSKTLRTNSLERFSCPTNFGARYEKRLRLAPDIQVLLGANCTGLKLDPDASGVQTTTVATLAGNRFSVTANTFVLATGGIETARLLLASNDVCPAGIGNAHDLVGRNYMCHIAGNVGTLTVNGDTRNVRHEYETSADGIYCRRRLCLSEAEQKRLGVGNMVARLHFPRIADPSHKIGVLSGLFLAKNFISYEYGKRLNDGKSSFGTYAKHALNVVGDAWDTSAFLTHWLRRRTFAERKFPSVILRNRSNRFSLEVHSEQFPNPDSRITLSEKLDDFGLPRVKVDWRYSAADIESVRKTLEAFSLEFAKSKVARLEFDPDTLEEDLTRFGAYGGHHIGTARMGDDEKDSVVDRNCRVHATHNLFIASSAVFPTSSQANPTLTIIAMSLRLADHLLARENIITRRPVETAATV